MSATAILLITISVFAHAGWNLLSKREPSLAFFAIALSTSALLLHVVLWRNLEALAQITPAIWLMIAAAGLAHAIYFMTLAGAYRHGDMSLAYPMLRALPVLFIAAISVALGRGHQISPMGMVGIIAVAVGCLILPLQSFRNMHLRDYRSLCCLLALTAALGTTIYTMLDDQSLRQLHTLLAKGPDARVTLLYVALQTTSAALWVVIFALAQPRERQNLRALWSQARWQTMSTGPIITGAYGLVLASMSHVNNVSYVAAFRQMSIPLGALLGIILLKESHNLPRIAGIVIVSLGLILVALY